MAIKYKIYDDQKLVYVMGFGKVTLEDLLVHIDGLSKDPGYQAPMKKLVDYRTTLPLILKREETDIFTQHKSKYQQLFSGEKCACVVNNEVDFGMTRVHGAYIQEFKIDTMAFRNIDEALLWLQVDLNVEELRID